MQKLKLKTNSKPICLKLGLEVKSKCQIRVVARSSKSSLVVYYDRVFDVSDKENMEIRLPQSTPMVDVVITCSKDNSGEANFRVTRFKKAKLRQYINCYKGKEVVRFIKFAQAISSQLPHLNVGDYYSDCGKYHFQILNDIEGETTPARIHNDIGFIQVNKTRMQGNTVPMNMAIFLHEFSHFFVNKIYSDETEADLNGLRMYLGLGYPIYESHKSFIEVFDHSDNSGNRERYDYIFEFVKNFDKLKFKICK